MIIPVRCFTCSKVLADKWDYYVRRCKELEEEAKKKELLEGDSPVPKKDNEITLDKQHYDKTIRQVVFEELQLDRICCRRMLLGHVDLIDII
jgi:DNA-directed RNA polymerase subunit N (RpoN/RPB10)